MSSKFIIKATDKRAMKIPETIAKRMAKGSRQALFFIGRDLRRTARKKILDKPKTGKIYIVRRGKRTRRHQASAPGEAPANLTGKLRKSVGFKVRGSRQLEFGAGLDGVNYAGFLENGTTRMEPRPYLRPSIRENERDIKKYLRKQIGKQLTVRVFTA